MQTDAAQTQTAFRALTPAYASPEQLKGIQITTTSDIYSLGVVFYELLTGERPFHFEGKSLNEIIKTITGFDPPPPSENPESKTRDPQLRGDLDNIALMALNSDPERRYQTVEAFVGDIERHVKGLPVLARPNTFKYRAEKFIRRNKLGILAASLVLIVLLAGLTATIWQARVAASERDQAQQAQAKAEQLNIFLQSILSAASPEEKGKDAKVIEILNDALQNLDTQFANQPELKAQALLTIGQTYNQLDMTDESVPTLRQALKLNSELYGEENKMTASCMIYLGQALLDKAQIAEAENLLTRAIESERKLSPAGSKDLAFALDVLGELNIRKKEYAKGAQLLQESIAMSDAILGANNPDSAFTLISLGRAQLFSHDLDAAEKNYRASIAIYRQLPPRYEVRLATVLLNLGLLLTTKGNYDEGIKTLLEADNIFIQKQGDAYTTFESKVYLCNAYYATGDLGQAIAAGNTAIDIGRKLKLETVPDFAPTLENIGDALNRTGKAVNAEPVLREALHIRSDLQPANENLIAMTKGLLGECLLEQKKYAEAEPLLLGKLEALKAKSPESPLVKSTSLKLFQLYKSWGKPKLAAQYRGS